MNAMTALPARAELTSETVFVDALHGLRGCAIAIVLFSHLGNYGLRLLPFSHDSVGKVGVWMFFGLSAFLLTRRLERQLSHSNSYAMVLSKYAVQRIFRIYPLFFLIVVAHVLLGDLAPAAGLRNLVLVDGWEELWAIPVEFKWYVAMPLLAVATVLGLRGWLVGALLLATVGATALGLLYPDRVFANDIALLPKAAPFLLGSWLALKQPRLRSPTRSARNDLESGLAVLALAATALLYRLDVQARIPASTSPFLSAMLGCVVIWLIALSLQPGWVRAALGSRPLVWLGHVSFSLYLSHMFVIRLMIRFQGVLPTLVLSWLSVAALLAVAWVLHRLVERPGIEAGYRLSGALPRWWRPPAV